MNILTSCVYSDKFTIVGKYFFFLGGGGLIPSFQNFGGGGGGGGALASVTILSPD